MIIYVDLAGNVPWHDAHLKVCLPAYYCDFVKLLADRGLFSIIDLDTLNPNASYAKELTSMAPFI